VYKLATQTTSNENSGAAFTVGEKNEGSSAYCISNIHHTRAADGYLRTDFGSGFLQIGQ
jgi:hypothetical protein